MSEPDAVLTGGLTMGILKKVIIACTLAVTVAGVAYALYQKIGRQAVVQAPATFASPFPRTLEQLQDDLNQDKYKKKVLSRFKNIEGLHGLSLGDISLTLLDYSYHILNDSGKAEPFFIAECHINISKFQKDAENLKTHLESTGRQAPIHIELPDSERTILGLIDNEKDELITFASVPKTVRVSVKFAELRRNKPEYIILSMEPADTHTGDARLYGMSTSLIAYDEKSKTYYNLLDLKTYQRVDPSDDIENNSGYVDTSTITWSDWINGEYRELIVSTERKALDEKPGGRLAFRNKKDIYGWVNTKELALVEQIVDGKSIKSKQEESTSPPPHEITLKDGELYDLNGQAGGGAITTTGGKINEYIQSPDKRYVAYSVIVGYTDDAGDYGPDEKIPQVPVYHIIVMDLIRKKQLTEIKPPSDNEPFIYAKRWSSNEELVLYDADGIAVGMTYFYNVINNALRRGNLSDLEEMSR